MHCRDEDCKPTANLYLEFFDSVTHHPPAFPSYTKAAYSNLAYAILGFAYENITGRSLTEAYEDIFQKGLGMSSTTPGPGYPPKNGDSIIPYNETFSLFNYSIGVQWP